MVDFPTSLPVPSKQFFSQRLIQKQLKTKMESGAVQSRPQHTSSRWEFTIGWQIVTQTQYAALCTFFTGNIGGTFNWTHPITTTVYVVRFAKGELPPAKHGGHVDDVFGWTLSGLILEQA